VNSFLENLFLVWDNPIFAKRKSSEHHLNIWSTKSGEDCYET